MQGLTPLHMAAHQGQAEVVSRLCRVPGNEVDAIDSQGRTALHHAAALGHDDVMMELWARGCNIEPADLAGWTGLSLQTAPYHSWREATRMALRLVSSASYKLYICPDYSVRQQAR